MTVLKSQNTILHPSQICILIFEPDLRIHSNASSFYRSQNIFGWSKIFVLYQKLIYIHIVLVQNFLCQIKRPFPFNKFNVCTKLFGAALNSIQFNFWSDSKKGWTSTKFFGTCRRTRHKAIYLGILKVWNGS